MANVLKGIGQVAPLLSVIPGLGQVAWLAKAMPWMKAAGLAGSLLGGGRGSGMFNQGYNGMMAGMGMMRGMAPTLAGTMQTLGNNFQGALGASGILLPRILQNATMDYNQYLPEVTRLLQSESGRLLEGALGQNHSLISSRGLSPGDSLAGDLEAKALSDSSRFINEGLLRYRMAIPQMNQGLLMGGSQMIGNLMDRTNPLNFAGQYGNFAGMMGNMGMGGMGQGWDIGQRENDDWARLIEQLGQSGLFGAGGSGGLTGNMTGVGGQLDNANYGNWG